MKRKKLIIIIGAVVLLIILLIAGKKAGWFGKSGNFEPVEISVIEKMNITEMVSAAGKIQPEVEVELSSEVSGEIIELPVVEGQQVKQGDLLAKVNPDIYLSNLNRTQASLQNVKAGYAQAKANLMKAQLDYNRYKILYDKGVVSKSEWDNIVAAYEVAKANKKAAYYSIQSAQAVVSEARDNLGRTSIYAPMDGTISKLSVELGERVVGTNQMAGTPIMRVADMGDMEVEVEINENDIVKVSVGDSAIVEVDAYMDKEFKGVVTEISNSANEALTADQVTNFKVKVKILEESYAELETEKRISPFRPGMTATVDVITSKKKDIIGVPISSIVIKTDTSATENKRKDNKSLEPKEPFECVFVKNGSEAKLQVVKTGIQDDTYIEILSGLKVGDTVITGPYTTVTKKLENGEDIEVKEEVNLEEKEE
ncbi:MAG TPA: efflux RND transporter periplasmic adaptor subunit [Flavobacteriaceae bacterium]|nr:efflux RND transporter periplasmic adaptor subunit [Flavobacteriaceae bacterium]